MVMRRKIRACKRENKQIKEETQGERRGKG
jgi:hypothetical protein